LEITGETEDLTAALLAHIAIALRIGGGEFILLHKREFQKLASQAQRQTEDDYWMRSALAAEASAKSEGQKAIPSSHSQSPHNCPRWWDDFPSPGNA
jgi:hypothetical protein